MKHGLIFGSFVYIISAINQTKVAYGDNCPEINSNEWLHLRCVIAGEFSLNLTSIAYHECTLECIRRHNCLLTNYNKAKHYCLLTNEKCIELELDDEFQLRYFGPTGATCLSWVPSSVIQPRLSPHIVENIYPARWRHGLYTVPGKFVASDNQWRGIFEGERYTFDPTEVNIEFLQVRPECQVTWLIYSAGNPIPDGAVIGGYLATGAESDVYMMLVLGGHFGYYDPVTELAYASVPERIFTTMKIMILM